LFHFEKGFGSADIAAVCRRFGIVVPKSLAQLAAHKGWDDGPIFASRKQSGVPKQRAKVRKTTQIDKEQAPDVLLNELRAIAYWDGQYERQHNPPWHEIIAYISRQKRRGEIIRQLLRFSA